MADKPKGSTAVMARRAPVELEMGGEGGDPLDYFPTPPWAARAGGELIRRLDPMPRLTCWEPACGAGHMVHGLADYFDAVLGSDIADRGAGPVVDFLRPEAEGLGTADWIVTNPPFSDGEAFARTAWRRARRGVALLLRLQFLEGGQRHRMFTQYCPLTLVAPFAERVPMVKGRWDPEASTATAYAWFIWDKAAPTFPAGPMAPRVHWIPPGSKERLTRPSDFELFAPRPESVALDLFDESTDE